MNKALKKAVVTTIITIIGVIGFVVAIDTINNNMDNTYTRVGYVSSVVGGCYTVTDNHGEEWMFYATDVNHGDNVTLVMNDCGTAEMFDDEVVDIIRE